ncbi:elongation factor G [Clostridium sp.]|uniref:elongation factor G n=1 Tax=Clostridium sp. TaxID=1506 RepID=UPI0039966F11
MKKYSIENLRNVGIMGHSSSGKTSLVEALLYYSKTIDRLGKIEEGNTISDYDIEERKRKISLGTSISYLEWDERKVNLIDTPGYFDFKGEVIEGMRAADMALIVTCAVSGVEVGTEKAWNYCNKINLPRAFFINKLDRENSDYEKTLSALKKQFGISVVPVQYPIGKETNFSGIINIITGKARMFNEKTKKMEECEVPNEYKSKLNECRQMLAESVAETDEELLEKYFDEGSLSEEEMYLGLIKGCASGEIAPVLCGSALGCKGMETLLEDIVECFPSPQLSLKQKAIDLKNNKEIEVNISEENNFSAMVFKTIADPFVGKLSMFKVMTGELNSETEVINTNKGKQEKLSNIFFMLGKNQIQSKRIIAGDIGAVNKLQYTETGDTLCDPKFKIKYHKMNFPSPIISMAMFPKSKGDEDKISLGLSKLAEEDKTFSVKRDVENAETIVSGLGETHIDIIANKLKNKFGVEVKLEFPKIPYRETIKGVASVQGKYKKQSGGHGQYGDVKIKFEARRDGKKELEFVDEIVGGVVPKNYIPAVEKGLKEAMIEGIVAGYPVIGLKATLYDGSYHPVDSSEMAFKVAASMAYKKGLELAKPILLEPIMHVEVMVPEIYMGDVIGDLNKKRGRVIGMEPIEKSNNTQKIIAEIPMSESFKYATDLSSITQARGEFKMSFERYDEVPINEVSKIIEVISKKK